MQNTLLKSTLLLGILVFTGNSAQVQQGVTIPAGTAIRVRTIDPIDVNSAQPGGRYRGSLADPVTTMNGAILIPRGAPVQLSVVDVQRAGRLKGRDRIDLKVDTISFNGRSYAVATSMAGSRGSKQGKRSLIGTGVGAGAGGLIGGLAGGGVGLAVGALVGGGGGAAVAAATKGHHLTIPPESVLSFQLQAPLRVR
jgi:hypothetical protein